jgi:hypothetical protein
LLAGGDRFLIVASDFGLRNIPPQLHERFETDTRSLDQLDAR